MFSSSTWLRRLRRGLGDDLRGTALKHLYLASYEVRGAGLDARLPPSNSAASEATT